MDLSKLTQGSSVLPDWHHSQPWASLRNPFGIYEVLEVCASGLRPPEDVYNVQAATALWLNVSRKEIQTTIVKSHSGVVASSLRFGPALHKNS